MAIVEKKREQKRELEGILATKRGESRHLHQYFCLKNDREHRNDVV